VNLFTNLRNAKASSPERPLPLRVSSFRHGSRHVRERDGVIGTRIRFPRGRVIAIPAIDLRAGTCAQRGPASVNALVDSSKGEANAAMVAREFARCGFRHLHLSDLDAAAGRISNAEMVRDILFDGSAQVMVRGDLFEIDHVRDVLASGARYAVVTARGIEDPEWLAEIALLFPQAVILAIEVHHREVLLRWTGRGRSMQLLDLAEEIGSLPLGGVLVTDLDRQRQSIGPDLALMEDLAEQSLCAVYAAGGIATMGQLRALEDRSVTGAIIGRALHNGSLNPSAVASEFNEGT
jgi:phosphoribosylformimino-5-aminoimidazole carboxamide ribonucleotide (ProFAR) isomerase